MQVYANTFVLEGREAFQCAVGSIHGWLMQVMDGQFALADILRTNEFSINTPAHPRLTAVISEDDSPKYYAWRLVHGEVPFVGRKWIVELGLKVESETVVFSCAVSTEEQSTLVRSPVNAARPRVIGYVLKNLEDRYEARLSSGVPGLQLKRLGGQTEEYSAFLAEIERDDRDYTLVLVGPCKDGTYLVNTSKLQDALFGLAQVIEVSTSYDSYEMEETLGKRWSVWDGAINIIRPKRSAISVSNSLLRSSAILEFGEAPTARISGILARVCHTTNVRMARNLVTPERVSRLALERRLRLSQALREQQPEQESSLETENALLEEVISTMQAESLKQQEDMTQLEYEKMELEDQIQDLEDKLRAQQYKTSLLQSRSAETAAVASDLSHIFDLACRQEQPSPEDCLEAVLQAYPLRCEVLDSAWKSAKEMAQFKNGRRLLDMLRRLMTNYFDAIQEDGDNSARKVFSADEYSAMESETVMRTPSLRDKRIFTRGTEQLEMFRHLKMGKKDNVELTLRVHFAWLSAEKKIVIGYCGEHLPIASR